MQKFIDETRRNYRRGIKVAELAIRSVIFPQDQTVRCDNARKREYTCMAIGVIVEGLLSRLVI